MAHYAYKELLEVLPVSMVDQYFESGDGADYDSCLYSLGADYIIQLTEEVNKLKQQLRDCNEKQAD